MSSLKQELEDYRLNRAYIKKEKEHILDMLEQAQKITSSLSQVRINNPVADRMAEKIVVMVDMQNTALDMLNEQEQRLDKIREGIGNIRQPYKNILYSRYVEGKDLVEIAAELGYTYIHICRLHGEALKIIKDVNKCY